MSGDRTRVSEESGRPAEGTESPPRRDDDEAVAGAAPDPDQEATVAAAPAPEVVDYRDRWLRAEAELQNYRRRASRELQESREAVEDALLVEVIQVVDDLERALEASREAGAQAAWSSGVGLVAQRARDLLARHGVTAVDPLGAPFDPMFHEALMEMEAPEGAQPGSVLEVVQKGYRRRAHALRPARVVVAGHREGR